MSDDWRLRIMFDEGAAGGVLERIGLLHSDADRLMHELAEHRLVVTGDDRTIFVYASSSLQLDQALEILSEELSELRIEPAVVREHWLPDEDRWNDEAAPDSVEAETLAAGYAPWEVRIPCASHAAAVDLAEQLEAEGYGVVRRWTFLIAGTSTREEAEALAQRLHGEVEPGGELVWEVAPRNPFAVFGGLGGS